LIRFGAKLAGCCKAMIDYELWPDQGCTLSEARDRVANRELWLEWRNCANTERGRELKQQINSEFFGFMRGLRLVAYGRPRGRAKTKVFIPRDLWQHPSAKADWSASIFNVAGESIFQEVRVFPVILAPCRATLLAGHALSEVLKRFVLEDPEVEAYAREGMKLAPHYEAVFKRGRCFPHGIAEWPVDSHRWSIVGYKHPDPERQSIFDNGREADQIEVVIAAEALIQRYRALIDMLKREVESRGLQAKSGSPDNIPGSIWHHEDFYINAQGDVLQSNEDCEDPPRDWLKRRWLAVSLEPRALAREPSMFHVKPIEHDSLRDNTVNLAARTPTAVNKRKRIKRPVAEALAAALKKRGLDRSPGHLSYKQIAAEIAPLMPGRPSTEQEILALSKAVARHYQGRASSAGVR
jgi:hypothetical protein